jgi:Tfp pilus assembly protein PilF
MKPLSAALVVVLAAIAIQPVTAWSATSELRGSVLSSDGTVIPSFTVAVRPISNTPQLIIRKRFSNGIFQLTGLTGGNYQFIISAPQFIGSRLEIEFPENGGPDFRVIVLHKLRNEPRLQSSRYIVSAASIEAIPAAARKAYEEGVEFHTKGRLADALSSYGRAIQLDPRYLDALVDVGTVYILTNHSETALAFFNRALDLAPGSHLVRLDIAVALLAHHDFAAAIKLLNNLTHEQTDNGLSDYYLATAYFQQKKLDRAEQVLNAALGDNPKLLDAVSLRMNIHLQQRKYPEAIADLEYLNDLLPDKKMCEVIAGVLAGLSEREPVGTRRIVTGGTPF